MQRHITEFLGPIFAKEIIEIARRWRYYLCRTVYGMVLVFVLYIAWEESQRFAAISGSANTLARIAGIVFTAASYVQYWSVYLLVPAFLCGVIAGEREEHTLDLLFITPLTDREIVLGKLFSRVAAMICLILCAVPVVSLMMLFGGISPESIWRVLAATLLAILFAGSHAIYFSTICRGPMEALSRTYAAFFMWLAGLAVFAWGLREFYQAWHEVIPAELVDVVAPLYLIYPLVSFWGAVNESYLTTLGFIWGAWSWPLSFVVPALWSVFLLWRAIRRLRQTPQPKTAWWQTIARRFQWRRQSPKPEVAAARRARAGVTWPGRAIVNPLWLRARLVRVYDRAGSIGRLQWLGWILCLTGILILAIYSPRDLGERGLNIAFQAPVWAVLALVTALVSGHSLIGDRRRGFLEQVIVTPLSGREIVDGTFLALWEHLRRLIWLPLALAVFFCITGASPIGGGLQSLVSGALFCAVLVWQGVACSLAARVTAGAVVSAFVLPIVVVFLIPMAALSFRADHGPALWIMIGIWFGVTWVWSWQKMNAVSVGCYMTALHLVLIALAECWTWGGAGHNDREEFPMMAMHPFVLIVAPLINYERSYQNSWTRYGLGIEICYWAALVMNIALIRFWLIRHFDRLVERVGTRPTGTSWSGVIPRRTTWA